MTTRLPIAQGDLLFIPVEKIPDSAKPVSGTDGRLIVGHSETGHHHVVLERDATMYEAADDSFTAYIRSLGAKVEHLRPHDTHAPVTLTPGDWLVKRQREYTPEGWRRVVD